MCPKYIPTYIFYIFYWYIHVIYTRSPSSSQSLPEIHPCLRNHALSRVPIASTASQWPSAPMHRKRYRDSGGDRKRDYGCVYIYINVSCNYIMYHLNKMCMTYEFVLVKNDVAKWFIYYESCNHFNSLQYIYIYYIYYTYILQAYIRKTRETRTSNSMSFLLRSSLSKVFWVWWPHLLRHIHLVSDLVLVCKFPTWNHRLRSWY